VTFLLGLLGANVIAVIAVLFARPRAYVVSEDDGVAMAAQRQRLQRFMRIAAAQVAVVTFIVASVLVSHLRAVAERKAARGADYLDSGGNYYAYRDSAITALVASVIPICCALYLRRARRRLEERAAPA